MADLLRRMWRRRTAWVAEVWSARPFATIAGDALITLGGDQLTATVSS